MISKCRTPLKSSYAPEIDVTPELKSAAIQYYQELIGVFHWDCEIGQVGILLEMYLLSTSFSFGPASKVPKLTHYGMV